MKKRGERTTKPLSTRELMGILIPQYLDQCIKCNRCMDACPVTKENFTIDELNYATEEGIEVPPAIKQFAFNCVQCGTCVPVCPVHIRRDLMVRAIKHKLIKEKPFPYKRYLLVKGQKKTAGARTIQRLFILWEKLTHKDIAPYMETAPTKQNEVLFYPGCYIYSDRTIRQTLRLLDHIGCTYTVLGGVTTCCGAPHLIQGDYDEADHCLEQLHKKIKALKPKLILTACAECHEALNQIKTTYKESFEIQSTTQYFSHHLHLFPTHKTRGNIMVHDSCRFSRDSPTGVAARHIARTYGELIENDHSCCYLWNHGCDKNNTRRRDHYLNEVQQHAQTLACTCITCYEEFKKNPTSLDIIDIQELLADALIQKKKKEAP